MPRIMWPQQTVSPGTLNGSKQETCQQSAVNQTHNPPTSALLFLLSIYYVPVIKYLYAISYLILKTAPPHSSTIPHFKDEENEAEKDLLTCPRSHCWEGQTETRAA